MATENDEELKIAIEEFAREAKKLKPYVRKAESALIEGLSKYISHYHLFAG